MSDFGDGANVKQDVASAVVVGGGGLLSLLACVCVEGLKGSLSELISRHGLAKSRHPDCSTARTHTHAHTHPAEALGAHGKGMGKSFERISPPRQSQ